MFAMGRVCKLRVWMLLSLLLMAAGCARNGFHPSDASGTKDPNLPFHEGADAAPAQDAPGNNPNADGSLPFDNSSARNLPAGTLLTVRLEDTLSTANPSPANDFAAILDVPVLLAGSTVLPQGTILHGKVESARASQVKGDSGYVRLTLKTLVMGGREVPVQTSSLFATGTASSVADAAIIPDSGDAGRAAHRKTIQLTKGRRLTFRLMASVSLRPAPHSAANLLPATE